MPDPDKLLNTLRRAARAFEETPGRKGRLIRLPDADEVMVVGDLHGNVQNFRRIFQRADLAAHPRRHLVFQEIIHGSFQYPDGGDRSHQAVDLVAALKCQYPARVHWLLGNHELGQWFNRLILKADRDMNQLFREGVKTAYGARADEFFAAYVELFRVIPAAILTPNRVFLSHSLPKASRVPLFELSRLECDDLPTPGDSIYSLVWGRDTSAETAAAFLDRVDADLLITGHIPIAGGFQVPNERQIILDAMGTPAGFCLFPTDRPLTHEELVQCVCTI